MATTYTYIHTLKNLVKIKLISRNVAWDAINYVKEYLVNTDRSILTQDGKPIAFFSKELAAEAYPGIWYDGYIIMKNMNLRYKFDRLDILDFIH